MVGISPDGPFPCKTAISFVFFLFESRQIQNLQLKLRKRKRVKILILSKEITQKTYILQSFQQGRERQSSPSESQVDNFIILKTRKRLTVETETGIRESQDHRRSYKQTEKCKMASDTDIPFSAMKREYLTIIE